MIDVDIKNKEDYLHHLKSIRRELLDLHGSTEKDLTAELLLVSNLIKSVAG